jgi:hypothetical protein
MEHDPRLSTKTQKEKGSPVGFICTWQEGIMDPNYKYIRYFKISSIIITVVPTILVIAVLHNALVKH